MTFFYINLDFLCAKIFSLGDKNPLLVQVVRNLIPLITYQIGPLYYSVI